MSKAHVIRTGDAVLHKPSGETWLVAYADYSCDEISACGWPDGTAKLSECELTSTATDEASAKLIEDLDPTGRRGIRARAIAQQAADEKFYRSLPFGYPQVLTPTTLDIAQRLSKEHRVFVEGVAGEKAVRLAPSTLVKIIATDNFDRDNISDELVADNVKLGYATTMCTALNSQAGPDDEWFYRIVHLDHELKVFTP